MIRRCRIIRAIETSGSSFSTTNCRRKHDDYVFYIFSAAVIGEDPEHFGFKFNPPLFKADAEAEKAQPKLNSEIPLAGTPDDDGQVAHNLSEADRLPAGGGACQGTERLSQPPRFTCDLNAFLSPAIS